MSDSLLKQLSDQNSINALFKDLIEEAQPRQSKKQRRNSRQNRQKNQQKPKPQQVDAAVEKAVRREKQKAAEKLKESERALRESYEAKIRALENRQSSRGIVPKTTEEMARMFIFAELIGKPPPGLS